MKKILQNEYLFSVISRILITFFGLVHAVLLARYLGVSIKGTVTYIQSIVSVGSILITFGLHQAYPYFRKKYNNSNFLCEYMTSIALHFVSISFVAAIITGIFWNNIVILSCCWLIILNAYSRITGYVVLVEKSNIRNLGLLIFSFLEVFYLVALWIWVPRNLYAGISAVAVVEICKAICFSVILFKNLKCQISIKYLNMKLFIELVKYGFIPMIALLMTTLNYKLDVLMLTNMGNVTTEDIGVYSIGIAVAEKTLLIPDAVKEILISKLTKGKGPDEVARVCRLCFLLGIIVAVGVVLLGPEFVTFVFGSEYRSAYLITVISLLGTVYMVFFKMIGQFNIVNKRQMLNMILLSVSIIVNILLNLVLIPMYGIHGAAIASAIAHLVCALCFVLTFSKMTRIKVIDVVLINKRDVSMLHKFLENRD